MTHEILGELEPAGDQETTPGEDRTVEQMASEIAGQGSEETATTEKSVQDTSTEQQETEQVPEQTPEPESTKDESAAFYQKKYQEKAALVQKLEAEKRLRAADRVVAERTPKPTPEAETDEEPIDVIIRREVAAGVQQAVQPLLQQQQDQKLDAVSSEIMTTIQDRGWADETVRMAYDELDALLPDNRGTLDQRSRMFKHIAAGIHSEIAVVDAEKRGAAKAEAKINDKLASTAPMSAEVSVQKKPEMSQEEKEIMDGMAKLGHTPAKEDDILSNLQVVS